MTKILESLVLIVAICLGLAWLASPSAQADEPSFPVTTLRDAFVCPGLHAEWLDDTTVQCLKEAP